MTRQASEVAGYVIGESASDGPLVGKDTKDFRMLRAQDEKYCLPSRGGAKSVPKQTGALVSFLEVLDFLGGLGGVRSPMRTRLLTRIPC